jgi:TIR domain-containing protein
MATSFTYDVFLSYSATDKEKVERLADRLRNAGVRVWFDDWIIRPGDDIFLAIEHGLSESRTLLLCLSPAALGSDWVGLERNTVLFRDPSNASRRFIPLLLADCVPPDTLRRYRHIDYRRESDAAFAELLTACRLDDPEVGAGRQIEAHTSPSSGDPGIFLDEAKLLDEVNDIRTELALIEGQVNRMHQWWLQSRPLSGRGLLQLLREGRYLLTRHQIRQIDQHKKSLGLGDSLSRYVTRSKRYRRGQLATYCLLVVVLISSIMIGYSELKKWQARTMVRGYGLPSDFEKYSRQLRELSVVCMVDDLEWLPRNLKSLDANCERIKSLRGVPQELRHLGLSDDTAITSLDGLPSTIEELNISGSGVRGIEGLQGHQIKSLEALGIHITNMKLLPRSLLALKLQHPDIDNLEGLPGGLVDLDIRGTSVRSLRDLPRSLRRLRLVGNDLLRIDSLPPHLETLYLENLMEDRFPNISIPRSLKRLTLVRYNAGRVPQDLVELELKGSFVGRPPDPMAALPRNLETLRFHDTIFQVPWGELPRNLRHLKLRWRPDERFELLPGNLVELDLSQSGDLTSLKGIGNVSILDISSTSILDLDDVPRSVAILRFNSCKATELTRVPSDLIKLDLAECSNLKVLENLPETLTDLNISKTAITKLENLPTHLLRLDISNSGISGSLPEIHSPLQELTLHAGQIDTLKGLPKSVWKIRFVDREKRKKEASEGHSI